MSGLEPWQLDRAAVRRAFERAAPTYDAAAVLQKEMAVRLIDRLAFIKLQPSAVLDAGCGTGYALADLQQRYPKARLTALDHAPAMLRQARAREGIVNRLWARLFGDQRAYVCGDLAALPLAANSQDLVFSNATLQWCNDLPRVFAEIVRVLRVDGLLMFTTFGPDTLQELRAAFASVDARPHTHRFLDLHDLGDLLMQAGFSDPVMDREVLTLTYDTARDMMRDLKAIGAHNASSGRLRGLQGKTRWAKLNAELERFRRQGKLPATYEVIYGHAWKPVPRQAADGRTIVRFQPRRPG